MAVSIQSVEARPCYDDEPTSHVTDIEALKQT